ncbi:MAG: efflux RND transporter periplasmic adaptor subunit [Pseudomonadota bacterium]
MRLAPLITALIVCAGVYVFILQRDNLRAFAGVDDPIAEKEIETEDSNDAISVSVQVLKSNVAGFDSGVVLRGRTEAFRDVDVAAEISGSVVSQPLRKGALVEEGQLLCQLDPGTLEAELAEARARLAEAEANNNVSASLVERGFASETTVISREASLESAMASVKRAEENLERLSIKAPFSGILETDTAELGALLQPGAICANIISLNPIKLVGFANEEQIHKLKLGTRAGARLVAGDVVEGEVTFLARSADPVTRTFRVEVTTGNEDLSLRDGATAQILIELPDTRGHLIPQSALTLDDSGALGIRAVEKSRAVFYPVAILRDTNKGVWVDGLPDEIDIIIVGQEYVNDGGLVDPTFFEEDT